MNEGKSVAGATARALYFTAPGKVEIRTESVEPRRGETFVTSRIMGISHGTEMLLYRGELPAGVDADINLESLSGNLQYPARYAYMNAGTTPDGRRVFAFYPHQDLFCASLDSMVELPDDMGFGDAVFIPSVETALTVVQDCAPVAGETVLVLGQGVIGLLISEILARSHFGRIITVDPHPLRCAASEAIGATCLDAGEAGLKDRIMSLTEGRGVDRAINVSGNPGALQTAIDTLAFGGTAVEASWYGDRTVDLYLGRSFHRRRLSVKSSQVSTVSPELSGRWDKKRRMKTVVELVRLVKPARYITHSFPLSNACAAFELIAKHPEKTIQVVLTPE